MFQVASWKLPTIGTLCFYHKNLSSFRTTSYLTSSLLASRISVLRRGLSGRLLHVVGNGKDQIRIGAVPVLNLNVQNRMTALFLKDMARGLNGAQDFSMVGVIGIICFDNERRIVGLSLDLGDKVLR